MKRWLEAAGLIAIVAVSAPSLSAQWPSYPTAGVPRMADGKPNPLAPTPRTADGKPDLSGIWETPRIGNAQEDGPPPPAPPPGTPPLATFRNVGAGFEDGLPFRPWAAELRKNRMEENSRGNPDAHCLPMGFMQFHMHPFPRRIVQTPGQILIIYEANYGLRTIFVDGRPLPNNDPQPWWYGYSIGKWDGDTLVVETTGFKDEGWLDVIGSPFTDALTTTERFRRVNYGNLEIDVTVDDPKAYLRPWTVRVNQRTMVDSEMIEHVCNENNRDLQHMIGK